MESTEERKRDCPVCLEQFQSSEIVFFSNCRHYLCKLCYDEYILSSNKCPLCRAILENEETAMNATLQQVERNTANLNNSLQRLKSIRTPIGETEGNKAVLDTIRQNLDDTMYMLMELGITYNPRARATLPLRQQTFVQEPTYLHYSYPVTNGRELLPNMTDILNIALANLPQNLFDVVVDGHQHQTQNDGTNTNGTNTNNGTNGNSTQN